MAEHVITQPGIYEDTDGRRIAILAITEPYSAANEYVAVGVCLFDEHSERTLSNWSRSGRWNLEGFGRDFPWPQIKRFVAPLPDMLEYASSLSKSIQARGVLGPLVREQ